MKLSFLIFLLLSSQAIAKSSAKWDTQLEVGHQYAYEIAPPNDEGAVLRNMPYVFPEAHVTKEFGSLITEGNLAVRGQHDFQDDTLNAAEVKAANFVLQGNSWKFIGGMQEIAWGETFGVYILDVVNPRDQRDPFFNDIGFNRLGVPAANGLLYLGNFTIQGIYNPWARNPVFAPSDSPLNPYSNAFRFFAEHPYDEPQFGEEPEYGGKVGYLTDFGVDLGAYYYNHLNRNLVYEFHPTRSMTLRRVEERVQSSGASVSYAGEEWVFRADGLIQHGSPSVSSNLVGHDEYDAVQIVAGVDYSAASGFGLGVQYHVDRLAPDDLVYALSTRLYYPLFNRKLESELFVYKGLNSNDLWLAPQLTFHFLKHFSFLVRLDTVEGKPETGVLGTLHRRDRVLTWLSAKF